tara:strand:- start:1694 stop:2113 length:420 start_codon:yes stop_codon:yes gene_type:complete
MKFDEASGMLITHSDEATTFSGIATKSVGTTTVTAGKIYYLTTAGGWDLADANQDEDHASHILGYAIVNGAVNTRGIALQGFVLSEEHGFALGAPIYLSNTAGAMTTTVPSSGFARIIGYAVSENAIYFDPSKTYVEIA